MVLVILLPGLAIAQPSEGNKNANVTKNMTTSQGYPISDDNNSLTVGNRGPTLLHDVQFIDKMSQFDRERIPERVLHAKGAGAFGYFQVYGPMDKYTKAKFLQNSDNKTPIFVRFSTVAGGRGSADTVRDVRGFALRSILRWQL